MKKLNFKEQKLQMSDEMLEVRSKRQKVKCRCEKNATAQAGITLVALVITIVVLLILAGITITYVFSDNGILSLAQKAGSETDAATVLEEIQQRLLTAQVENEGNYTNTDVQEAIEAVTGNSVSIGTEKTTTKSGTEIAIASLWRGYWYNDEGNITNGTVTLALGDYVDYTPEANKTYTSIKSRNGYNDQVFNTDSYAYGWRVLGVEEDTGDILIISEDLIGPISGGKTSSACSRTSFKFYPRASTYPYYEEELNSICAIYGTGEGATGARSVTVDDINKITGYDPETAGFGEGTVYEYGNTVTYTINSSGYIDYIGTIYPIEKTESSRKTLQYFSENEWKSLTGGGAVVLESTYYNYYPNTLTSSSSGETLGLELTSTEYYMLFTNSPSGAYPDEEYTTSSFDYWLSSKTVGTYGCGPNYRTYVRFSQCKFKNVRRCES